MPSSPTPRPAGDTGGPEMAPWQQWLRQAGLVLVIVFFGVGLVYVLYDRGILPLAGPFVAMLLVPAILFFRASWLRGRISRSSREVVDRLRTVEELLAQERALPVGDRPSRASDASLDEGAEWTAAAVQEFAWANEAAGAARVEDLVATARASWAPGSPLCAEAVSAGEAAQQLTTRLQRMEKAFSKRR